MSGVWIFLVLLMSVIISIIEPGEALLPKLKCWRCDADDRTKCSINTTISTTCRRGHFCSKLNVKYHNPADGMDWTRYRCIFREEVLYHAYALNECVEGEEYNSTTIRCICDKNDCNAGHDFIPTFKLTPGLTCWSYIPYQSFVDIPITTTTCNKEYYCYKYLLKADEKGTRNIQRGCIHKKLASTIGVNINQCGEFENDYEKYPFCICDQDKCNSGNYTLKSPVKPPCPSSSNLGTNTFQQISLILIWILA